MSTDLRRNARPAAAARSRPDPRAPRHGSFSHPLLSANRTTSTRVRNPSLAIARVLFGIARVLDQKARVFKADEPDGALIPGHAGRDRS
jgi:hypothetical protein